MVLALLFRTHSILRYYTTCQLIQQIAALSILFLSYIFLCCYQILQHGLAVTGQGQNDGVEHGGHQTAGEAVVVQVHAGNRVSGIEHHRGVEEAGNNTVGPAEIAGHGSEGSAEQTGQLHGRVAER